MNKRFKQLADEAGFVRFSPQEDPHTPIDWSSDYSSELEKFAELIVKECAKVVDIWSDEVPPSEGYDKLTVGKLKEHFGVE